MGTVPRGHALTVETAKLHLDQIQQAPSTEPAIRGIEALYRFKLRETEAAFQIWRQHQHECALATTLFWIGQEARPTRDQIEPLKHAPYFDLLQTTLAINRNALAYSEGEQLLDNIVANAH